MDNTFHQIHYIKRNYPLFTHHLILKAMVHALSIAVGASAQIQENTYLDGFQFWSLPVAGIEACAMACTRLPLCMSFNFDLYSRNCELNTDVLENQLEGRVSKGGSQYSPLADWVSQVRY